ncbi:MAG: YecA family protein [Bacteroidota bacterium]
MRSISKFEHDFEEATHIFPKLKYRKDSEANMWVVAGELDICDSAGDFWGAFTIAIYVPISYPYCVPHVKEISTHIRRNENWHISDRGDCCVDIEHKLLIYEKRGFNISQFIKTKVYPYFANQIYKEENGEYAKGEYGHNFEGVQQFYREELNINSDTLAVNILQKVISNNLPGRNDPCICGIRKFKYCHFESVQFLQSLPIERLQADLDEFLKLIS